MRSLLVLAWMVGAASSTTVAAVAAGTVGRTRFNMASGATIFAVGDVVAQRLEAQRGFEGRCGLKHERVAQSASLGSVWNGFCSPLVYRFADHLLPGRRAGSVLLKAGFTSGVLATAGNYCNMLARRLLSGQSIASSIDAIHEAMNEVIAYDLCIFPLVDAIQFAWVPPACRPVLTASVCCCWSVYISMVSQR